MSGRKRGGWSSAILAGLEAKNEAKAAPAPLTTRQKAARTRKKNTGKWLEKDIADFCAIYEQHDRARVRKVDPPTQAVRVKGQKAPILVNLANPFLDFVGAWTERQGRAIFAEAKSTEEDRLPLDSDSGLKVHQRESLQAWRTAGAAVCVLWGYKGTIRYLSLALIEARLANGHKSILWAHAQPIAAGMGFLRFDWLANLAADESL